MQLIAGVDEAGRGALAGPVVAAAVILNPKKPIKGLADSKKLQPKERERLALLIQEHAIAWAVAQASVAEIDSINILQANLLAMQRAVGELTPAPIKILVDGRDAPQVPCVVQTIIGGDDLEPAISAASILAKVFRDQIMRELDAVYPVYLFAKHKGYGTEEHMTALTEFGPCEIHRYSYAPVRLAAKMISPTRGEISST
jgi:ribonuclease HII